mmetsp:Transcript_59140/g.117156  ORF Transcript_59140/g.117156 Transcript_59140/m.117156 type:complete len:560 (+) Transcript_59140:162-1841(+)
MCLGFMGSGPECNTEQWALIFFVVLLCIFFIIAGAWWSYTKIRKCNRRFPHGDIKNESLPTPADEAEPLPSLLCVDSPNKTCCEGEYDLVVKDRCNKNAYWLKKDGSRFLISGSDGHWYLARSRGSNSRNFTRIVRLIRSQQPHDNASPDKVDGWAIKRNFRWRVDPSIAVQAPVSLLKEDRMPSTDPNMLEIDFKDHSALACGNSFMCNIGTTSGKSVKKLFLDAPSSYNSDLSTAASSKQATEAPTWIQWSDSHTAPETHFKSVKPTTCTSSGALCSQWRDKSKDGQQLVESETSTWIPCSTSDSHSALEGINDTDCSGMSYQRTGLQYLTRTVAGTPRLMEGPRHPGPGEYPVDPPAQRLLPPKLPPQALHVFVPRCQTSCSGLYVLVPDEQPNGHPLWRQTSVEPVHWLYCSSSGRWCFCGEDVRSGGFQRSAGYVAQAWPSGPHVFPHDGETSWQLWDNDSQTFLEDSAIQVTEQDIAAIDIDSPISDARNISETQPSPSPLERICLARSSLQVPGSTCGNQRLDEDLTCKDNEVHEVPPVIEVHEVPPVISLV